MNPTLDSASESQWLIEYDFEWTTRTCVNVNHLRVPFSRRREGHARTVLSEIIEHVSARGAEAVVVNIKGGEAARSFLEGLGFDIIEYHPHDGHVTAERELRY